MSSLLLSLAQSLIVHKRRPFEAGLHLLNLGAVQKLGVAFESGAVVAGIGKVGNGRCNTIHEGNGNDLLDLAKTFCQFEGARTSISVSIVVSQGTNAHPCL